MIVSHSEYILTGAYLTDAHDWWKQEWWVELQNLLRNMRSLKVYPVLNTETTKIKWNYDVNIGITVYSTDAL